MTSEVTKGVAALIAACMIWGFAPIFFRALMHLPALDVLAHRILWSLVFFGLVLALQRRLNEVFRALGPSGSRGIILAAAMIVSVNWGLFIYTVQIGQTVQSSLGYYIFPLVAVLIGRLVFSERLVTAQWMAVALAVLAILTLTIGLGTAPRLAMALAVSFGLYTMIKKRLDLGPVVSVTAEVVVLTPAVVVLLWLAHNSGRAFLGPDATTGLLLVLSGPVTALPLILFSYAARRLTMATVGVLQYLNPTLQFACAVFLFAEPFTGWHLAAFAMIWTAAVLYSVAAWRQERARRTAARQVSASGTAV